MMFCVPEGEMLTVSGFTVKLAVLLLLVSAMEVAVAVAVQVPVTALDRGAV